MEFILSSIKISKKKKKSMNVQIVLCLCFLCCKGFDGNVSLSFGSNPFFGEISANGEKLVIDFSFSFEFSIFHNTGSTFQLNQTIPFAFSAPPSFGSTDISPDGNRIAYAGNDSVTIYQQQSGQYSPTETIPFLASVKKVEHSSSKLVVSTQDGKVHIYNMNDGYELAHTIHDGDPLIGAMCWSEDETLLVYGGGNFVARIWKENNGGYDSIQNISLPAGIRVLGISLQKLLIVTDFNIHYFPFDGAQYVLQQNMTTSPSLIGGSITHNLSTIWANDVNKTLYQYQLQDNAFVEVGRQVFESFVLQSIVTPDSSYCVLTIFNQTLVAMYNCPEECVACVFPNNCTVCVEGYELVDGVCEMPVPPNMPSQCVGNKWESQDVCSEYCSRECETCWDVKDDCASCAQFYTIDAGGKCVMESEVLDIVSKVRPFLNLIRRGVFKYLFLFVDDLWLYEYHQTQYEGILKVVFSTIRFVEDKQWEIIKLDQYRSQLEEAVERSQYNVYSNVRYMQVERKNNALMVNTVAFFTFFVLFVAVFLFVVNRLFRLLFNFEISKYIRPYSFWGGSWLELLVGNNIEFFTFLAFRSFDVPFRLAYSDQWVLVLSILMFFLVCVFAIAAYPLMHWHYGKLGKYFLINMFRFPSSYWLMTVLYGCRPLLKGVFHACLYHRPVLQISCLMTVEALALLILLSCQFVYENHKSFFTMFFQVMNSGCLIILNMLILVRYHHYSGHDEITILAEECTIIIMWCSIAFTIMRTIVGLIPTCDLSSLYSEQPKNEEIKRQSQSEEVSHSQAKNRQIEQEVCKSENPKQEILIINELTEEQIHEKIDEAIINHYLNKLTNKAISKTYREQIKSKLS